jgi:hypothetical protein
VPPLSLIGLNPTPNAIFTPAIMSLGNIGRLSWSDPITQVKSADIKGFEGALLPGDDKKEWLLL